MLRNDKAMYKCYAYLALLRLDELTFPQFRFDLDMLLAPYVPPAPYS